MSIRVDSSPLITGAVVVGDPGLGVLAESVPSTGEHGPGIAYTWLGPAEAGKEVRVLITQWPEVGSLFVWEDTSFEYNGPGGTAYVQLYVEGQPVDTPQTVTMVVGESSAEAYSGGSTNNLSIQSSGSGTAAELASGGSTSTLNLTVAGSGEPLEKASGGSTSILDLAVFGSGAQATAGMGGSTVSLSLSTTGAGVAKEQSSGGSSASLNITSNGAGVALEKVSGGSISILNLSTSGGGASVGPTSGGSTATLSLSAYGQGVSSIITLSNLEILSTTSSTVSLRFLVTRG